MVDIDMSVSIQNNFEKIWALKDCKLCATLWAIQEANDH